MNPTKKSNRLPCYLNSLYHRRSKNEAQEPQLWFPQQKETPCTQSLCSISIFECLNVLKREKAWEKPLWTRFRKNYRVFDNHGRPKMWFPQHAANLCDLHMPETLPLTRQNIRLEVRGLRVLQAMEAGIRKLAFAHRLWVTKPHMWLVG